MWDNGRQSLPYSVGYQRMGEGVFTLTMHPQVIGRGHRILMLEQLIEYMKGHEGVTFKTMSQVAAEWKQAHPLAKAE